MNIFEKIKFGNKKEYLKPCSQKQAMINLELGAKWLVKNARWASPYIKTKINELRRPLLQLRLARRANECKEI